MEEPLRQIVHNAGYQRPIVVGRIRESEYENFGFNAEAAEHGNLVKMGGINPGKVTRLALQNAASVAALMLTTEALVPKINEEKKAAATGVPGAACTEPQAIFAGQSSWDSERVPTQSFSNEERHAPFGAEEGEMSNAEHRNLVLESELIRNRALRTGTGTSRRVTLS